MEMNNWSNALRHNLHRLYLCVALMLCSGAIYAISYTPGSVPNPKKTGQNQYVCNPDGIVNQEDVGFLNQCARELEDATGVELCVVALDDIGNYDAFDFCYELFQRWGIGKEGKNTGVLMLLAMQSRDVRIMTGGGIEGVLTDAVCSQIIQKNMLPALRDGDYSGGLCLGALRIYEICTDGDAPDELRNMVSVTNRYKYAGADDDNLWLMPFWVFMLLFVAGIGLFAYILSWFKSKCPKCGKHKLKQIDDKVITAATYSRMGTGVKTYVCSHCGHRMERPYTIPKKTRTYISGGGSSFGGGFSGGSWGGGSTFGGGAGSKF